MSYYNVWNVPNKRWANRLPNGSAPSPLQDPVNPKRLTYVEARKVLEQFIKDGWHQFHVRVLNDDNTSGGVEVGYNVWNKSKGRWTNSSRIPGLSSGHSQNIGNPLPISYEEAQEVLADLMGDFEIRMIGSDLQGMPVPPGLHPPDATVPKPATVPDAATKEVVAHTDTQREEKIDWDVYAGFKPAPQRRIGYISRIDPYTGLPVGEKTRRE